MTALRAIIADDEQPLRNHLRLMLSKIWPDLNICAEAANGPRALEIIQEQKPDIAFLDIKMPGLSGIQVAEKMTIPCQVVFITAFDAYAVEAFEKDAVDYILKPANEERLRKTAERLKSRFNQGTSGVSALTDEVLKRLSEMDSGKTTHHLEWVNARQGDEIRVVPVADIIYFKAEDKYTVIRTLQGEHLIRTSIQKLEASLDPDQFWRVHRGTIVHVRHIKTVHRSLSGRMDITLNNLPETLTVSRTYAHRFKQM
jgi:DNA-binding LytR/AlgR family response regulator